MKPLHLRAAALLLAVCLPAVRANAAGFQSVFARDASDIIAVGDGGDTYRSLDGGLTWYERGIGSPSLTLRRVTGRGLNMLIASDGGLIWVSHDAGGAWAATVAPMTPDLHGAAMADDTTWVVTGSGGAILRTTNAGATWDQVASGTSQTLNAVTFADAQNGWAVGNQGTVLQTTNAGASWSGVAIGATAALLSVAQRGNVVWVVGVDGAAYRSTNGGASFSPVALKLDARADGSCVAMVSPDTLFLGGGGGFIRYSTDGGAHWAFQKHALHAPLTDLAVAGNGVWAANAANRVVMWSDDRGNVWHLPPGATLARTWVNKYSTGVQVRGSGFALNSVYKSTIYCGIGDRIERSRDDGETWQLAATLPSGYSKCNAFIVSAKDSNLWLAALSGSSVAKGIFRSAHAGSDWVQVVTHEFGEYGIPLGQDPDHPDTVYFGGETNGNGSPTSPLYRTFDFGAHWDSLPSALFRSPCGIVVMPDTAGLILVGDGVTGVGSGQYLKSTNGGTSFAVRATMPSSEIPGLATCRLRPGMLIGTNWSSGGVQQSTDYGQTWPTIVSGGSANGNQPWAADIARDDPNVIVYGQYSLPYEAKLSTDGGATFTTIPAPSGFNNNYGLYARDRGTIFAEQSSGIWKLVNTYNYAPAAWTQSLQLTSPIGGESWTGGSTHAVTWNASGIAVVRIEYRRSASEAWQYVADVNGHLSSYAWTLPHDITNDAAIRVSDLWDASPADQTDPDFTVATPRLVTAPAGIDFGTQGVGSGTVLPVTLQNTGTGTLHATSIAVATSAYAVGRSSLTLLPGQQDTVGVWFVPSSAGTFADTVTVTSDDSAGVPQRVALTGNAVGGTVTVDAPNGGETWSAGSTHDITWSATYVSTVALSFRPSPDAAWIPIAAGLPASPATYAWNVPYVPGPNAMVRVVGSPAAPFDTSDAVFTLLSPAYADAPDVVHLPATQVGYVSMNPLTLANPGNAPLTVSAIAITGAEFWVGRTSLTLAGGESDTVGVYYQPVDVGNDSATVTVTCDVPGPHATGVTGQGVQTLAAGDEAAPLAFALTQNRPNPFSRATLIQYALPRDADVTLEVYDLRGQRVATLVQGRQAAGRHEARFGAGVSTRGGVIGRVPAGVYFVRLQAGAQSATRKMLRIE